MKKNAVIMMIVMLTFTSLTITGCASTKVYDKTIPEDQMSLLVVANTSTVKQFNNQSVKWKGEYIIKIPSGRHSLTLDMRVDVSLTGRMDQWTTFTSVGNRITGEFEAGKKYIIFYNGFDKIPMIMEVDTYYNFVYSKTGIRMRPGRIW